LSTPIQAEIPWAVLLLNFRSQRQRSAIFETWCRPARPQQPSGNDSACDGRDEAVPPLPVSNRGRGKRRKVVWHNSDIAELESSNRSRGECCDRGCTVIASIGESSPKHHGGASRLSPRSQGGRAFRSDRQTISNPFRDLNFSDFHGFVQYDLDRQQFSQAWPRSMHVGGRRTAFIRTPSHHHTILCNRRRHERRRCCSKLSG
jgi:hypothetical protein